MYADEASYTYEFKVQAYGWDVQDWIVHNTSSNKFKAIVTQDQIDQFCGVDIDGANEYHSNTVEITLEVTAVYNTHIKTTKNFKVFFENPKVVHCTESELIEPVVDTLWTRANYYNATYFTFPEVPDSGS